MDEKMRTIGTINPILSRQLTTDQCIGPLCNDTNPHSFQINKCGYITYHSACLNLFDFNHPIINTKM